MKFNLFHKIFSAFLIAILAAVVVLSVTMYFSANWKFSEYVIKVEMGTLDDLVAALGSVHQEKQSWQQFREDPDSWFRFILLYLPEIPGYPFPPPPRGSRPPEHHRERPYPPGDPPPRPQEPGDTGSPTEFPGPGAPRPRPHGPPPPQDRKSVV